ncbi:hypothetical protein B0H13DRAFT_1887553 [Mycena leptocephala]|nr:hypothetical protein B0H13DRAFT_1887553 [Mycena leptocephala]
MHPEFHAALLSHGIATALTTVCRALSHSALEVAEIQLKGFLWALADNLGVFPRHRWITESLRAGLLPAIFSCSAGRHIERTGCDATAAFRDAALLDRWERFLKLVGERFQVVDAYNTSSLAPTKACDNLKRMLRLVLLLAGMSEKWLAAWWTSSDVRGSRSALEPAKDGSFFLRALLTHDYKTHQEEIALDQLLFLHENPSEVVPYTLFDYRDGLCEIDVGSHPRVGR